MILYLLFSLIEAQNTKEKYGQCIKLLSTKIPIDKNREETKVVMKRYIQYFDRHPPSYKEKEQICNQNKELFLQVGKDILASINLQNQITDKQMARCISRNLPLFAYTVVYMANGQYSAHMAKIKRDFLNSKSQQTFTRKVYVTPNIPRPDKDTYFDLFSSIFNDDNQDNANEILMDDEFLNDMQNEYFNNF